MLTVMRTRHPSVRGRAASRRQAGFTLIELVIVVALIGVIAAVSIPELRRSMIRAKMLGEVGKLQNAIAVARMAAIKRGSQVTMELLPSVPSEIVAWYDDNANGLFDAGERTLRGSSAGWTFNKNITVTEDPDAADGLRVIGINPGLVFLPNGTVGSSSSGSIGSGQGAFRLSDMWGNQIKVRVFGSAGTVRTLMLEPESGSWDTTLRHWRSSY